MTDVITKQIFGTAQTVINLASNIASGDFSGAPAATFDNTTDAAAPYALLAQAMAEFPDWSSAPAANMQIELWGVLKDVDGTDDDTDAPSGADPNGARYFGSWRLSPVDALQRRTIVITVEGLLKVDFYLRNTSGRQMTNTGTPCVLKIRPLAYGVGDLALAPPTWVSVSLGGSRAGSLPLAAGTYDMINAEPAFTIPSTLSSGVLATARIIADVRSADASVSVTPKLVNASTLALAGTGVACTATADDYTGTNQHQTVPVTLVAGQSYKAQAVVSAGTYGTFCTVRLEIG